MFQKFPSLTRFSHDWTITEKIDGSNGQIVIDGLFSADDGIYRDQALAQIGDLYIFAGSRNKLLGLGKGNDNMGFAQWVQDNAPALVETLGEGRHFGEWCGSGIQRTYGLDRKLFVLFNTNRWKNVWLPDGLRVVPVLAEGYMNDPGQVAAEAMAEMLEFGSVFAPGFMKPEGVVMRHGPSGTVFKKTYDYDEQGKWAENQARKENA
jgi:RNA ligase